MKSKRASASASSSASSSSAAVAGKKDNKSQMFLEQKTKKKWIDTNSGHNCFMMYARALVITWGGHENWTWNCFKETGDENIEVAKLSHVCWLDVRGKFKLAELTPGIVYEIVYVVKLTKVASGWELPITTRLSLPDGGEAHQRQVNLFDKPRGEWIEVNLGNFSTTNSGDRGGEVYFDLMEHGGHWKSGIIIKGAILRPKH